MRKRFDEFDYANVLTVHKAQGSQWDDVVLFDESAIFAESRQRWLYTGVTRAAKRLTVVDVRARHDTISRRDRIRAIEDRLEIYNLIASHPPSADTGADYYNPHGLCRGRRAPISAAARPPPATRRSRRSRRRPRTRRRSPAGSRISPACRGSSSTATARWSPRICRS